jgi:GMP synthase (glutamine-hydrolysing)
MFRTPTSHRGEGKQRNCRPVRHGQARTDQPVLLLLHQKTSCAGAVGLWLRRHHYNLDIRHPTLGDKLPENLDHHAAIIVFGGPMSANDDVPVVNREIDWLALPLKKKRPYLGICLGAQMMVRQLGGEVWLHKEGLVEIGYHRVKPTGEGIALFADWPQKFFQWHKEGFSIPSDAVCLAGGNRFENQAYAYNSHVYGVQFHPEITTSMIERWSERAGHMLDKKGAHDAKRLIADHHIYGEAQHNWLHNFMTHWTALIEPRESTASLEPF